MAKLQLCQLLTEDQLLELINFSLACKVPWAPFALSCFLQDALDLYKDTKDDVSEMETDATSSNWPSDDPGNSVSLISSTWFYVDYQF